MNKEKTRMQSYGSEYCMSAGDNALTREQSNDGIVSKATTNEHSFREACMEGLNDISNNTELDSQKPH